METPVFRKPYRISAAFVASTRRPGKYVDRHGLLYRVYPSGARCWEQRITVNGRRRTYGLGSYPVVSLSEARERAFENLRLVRSGGDPGAERMKGRVEHMVPLSTRALAVLEEARELAGGPGTEAVFPNREGRFFGESRFRLLLRALRVEAVPHGFRASLRSWCADTGVDRELAEACLAHTVGNQTELAYKRTLIMERRRPIMEAWAQYVGEGTGSAAAEGSGAAAVRPGPFG